ncbi:hypothetical protein P22_1129 [Propionispora sp. 2/2-37]|nr:hypothetical protein P22_1129 [Propionispora sp. 2/2-37]
MGPLEMAAGSPLVAESYSFLLESANEITDSLLREKVLQVLENPAPSFMQQAKDPAAAALLWERIAVRADKQASSLEDLFAPCSDPAVSPQPFWSAPGSNYDRHHAYPGGLAVHTAMNLKVSLALARSYYDIYRCRASRNVVIAAQILHDSQKPWVLQWNQDGSCRQQKSIAGERVHHVAGLAESVYRGIPCEVVLAQASAHVYPGNENNNRKLAYCLETACLLANTDPADYGVTGHKLSAAWAGVEPLIIHMGDSNWVLSLQAAMATVTALKQYALTEFAMSEEELASPVFYSLRNYVFSMCTMIKLYEILSGKGYDGFRAAVREIIH